jgi:DnaK suppressor protein
MLKGDGTRQTRLYDLLVEEKRRLWNELRFELFNTLGENLNKQYDIPLDIGERSVLDLLEDTGLTVADIRIEKLTLMDNALLKLENGSYGICDECGKDIDEARLNVFPYAACCAVCQQQREGTRKTGTHY